VLDRVAQRTIWSDVDLLPAWDDNTKRECAIATSEDGAVAARAGRADARGAVGGGAGAAEVELVTASSKGQKVDGRAAAGRDDAEVRGARGSRRSGGSCRRCRRRCRMSRSSRSWNRAVRRGGQDAGDGSSESESVLHVEGIAEGARGLCRWSIGLGCGVEGRCEAGILLRSCGVHFSRSSLPPYIFFSSEGFSPSPRYISNGSW
jgi:hypothetical protein